LKLAIIIGIFATFVAFGVLLRIAFLRLSKSIEKANISAAGHSSFLSLNIGNIKNDWVPFDDDKSLKEYLSGISDSSVVAYIKDVNRRT